MSRILVAGAGGFIGGHLVKRLAEDGHDVVAADVKSTWEGGWWQLSEYRRVTDHGCCDLREYNSCLRVIAGCDAVVNLAADMGGMGFIAAHRADCMGNATINLNLLRAAAAFSVDRFLFASSACVYNQIHQVYEAAGALHGLAEREAYPADPDSDYGWEKLYSERCVQAFADDYGFQVFLPRIHNCYGPHGTWTGGREKAPAAVCRKVAQAIRDRTGVIEIWGDGEQTRSFMWIDDCVEGLVRLLASDVHEPINVGSSELVSINQLVTLVEQVAGVELERRYVAGPQGVRGRCSDNSLIRRRLGWEPSTRLADGIERLYRWVSDQVGAETAA